MKYTVIVTETRTYNVECVVEADTPDLARQKIEDDGTSGYEVNSEFVDCTNVEVGAATIKELV